MADHYDVVVIGAGPGGYVAAIRAAQLGLKAAIVEKDAAGGLCLNWGCVPSKALLAAAELVNLFGRAGEFGITYKDLTADLGIAVDRSREVVTKMVGGVETLLSQNKVTTIHGTARLTGPTTIDVTGAGEIQAMNIILATGGVARSLPSLPIDGERVITSREALTLRTPPASVVIVGGGPIGVEFAYLYRAYGAEVTVVELLPRLLPNEDEDVSRELERAFTSQGIKVMTSTRVDSVATAAAGATVSVTSGKQRSELQAERVLVGVGFDANTAGLGLEEIGVELERGFVKVDDHCRTNLPSVWAVGDVTGRLQLAHVASHQGVTAVEAIAGRNPPPINYDAMPRAVYCQPQVASLGLTEAQARERGHEVKTGRFPFRANGKALASGDTEGFIKLVADAETNALLGYHMVGHGVTELLGEASLATVLEATTRELSYAVYAHPTLSEAIKEAALAIGGEAIHYYSSPRQTAAAGRT